MGDDKATDIPLTAVEAVAVLEQDRQERTSRGWEGISRVLEREQLVLVAEIIVSQDGRLLARPILRARG